MAKPKKQNPNSFQSLLQMSESFLQTRNFTSAHEYALLAQEADPAHTGPPSLLAISSVLKASPSDHYSILSLPIFTKTPAQIKAHYHHLEAQLNPAHNPFPFAEEAYGLVVKSWGVLGDVAKKMKYDEGLGRGGSFWTMCPYCYYVFEYLRVYEGCGLRCQNGNCGKAFCGVALGEAPPEEALAEGVYRCPGFVVLSGDQGGGGGKGWSPFGLVGSFPCGKGGGGECVRIEISDDEVEDDEGVVKGEKAVEGNVGDDRGVKVEGEIVGEVGKEKGGGGGVGGGKRIKKAVPMSSRKIMGKGVRVKRSEVLRMQSVENLGCGGGGNVSYSLNHGAETGGFEDDDILVMLQDVVVPTV